MKQPLTVRVTREVARRRRAEKSLRQSRDQLEQRIQQRMMELGQTNQALQAEITERKRTEEQLRVQATALDAAANAIVITDHNGTIQSVNPAFTALTGYTAQEAVGQNPRLLKSGKQDGAFYQNLWQAISSGQVWSGEVTNRRKDGSLYAEEMTITPLRNADGVIARYIAIKQDITERKRAEAGLKLFRALIDHSSDSIYVMDPATRRFLDVNESGCRALGYSRDEMLALTALDVSAEGNRVLFDAADTQLEKAGRVMTKTLHRRKDGTTYPVEASLSLVTLDREYLVAIVRDITERKRAEEARQERSQLAVLGADVGTALTRGGTLAEMLRGCSEAIVRQLNAAFARVWTLNARENMLELQASAGIYTHLNGPQGRVPVGTLKIGLIAEERKPHLTNQVVGDPRVGDQEWAKREGMVAFAGYPLVVEDRLLGVVAMFARHTLTDTTLEALASISKNIAVGIERKQAEEALRASQQIIEGIINAIPVRVFWKDKKLVYLGCNAIFARDAGFADPKDLIGKDDYQMGWRAQADKYREDDRHVIESGCSKLLMEESQTTPDGKTITLLSSKIPLRSSNGEIAGVIGTYVDITERKRVEQELQWKTAFLEAMVDTSDLGILVVDQEGRKSLQNQRFVDLFKIPPHIADEKADESRLRWVTDMTKYPVQFVEKVQHLYAHPNESSHDEVELKDGTTLERYSAPVVGKDRKYYGRAWTFRDITERKRFDARLFQSQKMETVGKLAGGIAHEFNSILTAIIGQCELLLGDLPAGSPLAKNATEISQAAGRAATLTRQLLAYGRKQILQPDTLDLNRVIASMEGMFHHLMGGDVETQIVPAPGLHAVKADAGQIEQVIMNLAINARDAMPNGGKFTLETANVSFDPESVGRYPELKPGDYVMLAITDTGAGMSEEVKAHLFEPFYSTKGVGQGTGLGLSTCYGIIKQSGGHIGVYSEPGRGATFKIYLPQVELEAKIPVPRLDTPGLPRGTETILLVEDDPALREMAATLLKRLGYTVLAAANGIEALSLKQQRDIGHIDLLFTDVVMPHMSGKELADRVRASHPHTRILFTSAYTENAVVHQGVLDKGVALLQKPFTPSALAHKLREVLDQPNAPAPDAAQKTVGVTKITDGVNTP